MPTSYAPITISSGWSITHPKSLQGLLSTPPVPLADLPVPPPLAFARVQAQRDEVKARLEKVIGLLASFDSAERIRLHLRNTGITAKIGDTRECMVSRFFRDHHGLDVRVQEKYTSDADHMALVGHPPVLTEFIRKFDRGEYPELVSEDSKWSAEYAQKMAASQDAAKAYLTPPTFKVGDYKIEPVKILSMGVFDAAV